ncbi:ribokinase [Fusarium oxysporum]|nr:ribokinase [Fusarium oxysporum]
MSPKIIAVIGALDADFIMVTSRIFDCGESVSAITIMKLLEVREQTRLLRPTEHARNHIQQEKHCQVTVRTGDDIQVKVIGAVGDDRYVPNISSSISFVMVDHTRENRCLFTPGARATWRKAYFINAKQIGGETQPDMVVSQMGIGKDVIETFLSLGVSNVVITLVENGAFYANAEGNGHCPALDVKVEDTTGAGDTLTGTYASDYKRKEGDGGWDIRNSVVRANKAAAIKGQKDIGSFDAPLKGLDFQ